MFYKGRAIKHYQLLLGFVVLFLNSAMVFQEQSKTIQHSLNQMTILQNTHFDTPATPKRAQLHSQGSRRVFGLTWAGPAAQGHEPSAPAHKRLVPRSLLSFPLHCSTTIGEIHVLKPIQIRSSCSFCWIHFPNHRSLYKRLCKRRQLRFMNFSGSSTWTWATVLGWSCSGKGDKGAEQPLGWEGALEIC